MSGYDLIALDMDGTVLNSRKEIAPGTREAIRTTLRAGKEVVFCTGRALVEMERFLRIFPDMHYLIAESGAYVYDLQAHTLLFHARISDEDLEKIFKVIGDRDIMPVAFSDGRYLANKSQIYRLAHYEMEAYAQESPKIATGVENLRALVLEQHRPVEKLNLFHTSVWERTRTQELLDELQPEAVRILSETSSLECSPPGIDKGTALARLSESTGILRERMIMVGDADNDLSALHYAGMAVAMGNANAHVKEISSLIVGDNDHDGCAEAIRILL